MPQVKRPWSLFSKHGLVLLTLVQLRDPTVETIGRVARLSNKTVLRALHDLECHDMVVRLRDGRRNRYRINGCSRFRHPALRRRTIEGLLRALDDAPSG